jgi:hypothetical protein
MYLQLHLHGRQQNDLTIFHLCNYIILNKIIRHFGGVVCIIDYPLGSPSLDALRNDIRILGTQVSHVHPGRT